jgi:glucose dehydrogenase (acceptor)
MLRTFDTEATLCRLSGVGRWSILLLEAGVKEPGRAKVPAFADALQGSELDWNYTTQPGNVFCGDQPCSCPRGKVLGGSSTINAMIYIRGNARDYDHWAELGNSL